MTTSIPPRVGLVMGSRSDWETMVEASKILNLLEIAFDASVVSAHRTPDRLVEFAKGAEQKGLRVIIAGAGGAAHLPGMIASHTHLPVLGVPIQSAMLQGVDSLLSIVQMPKGVPVMTLAIGPAGAANAALSAAAILSLSDVALRQRLLAFRAQQTQNVLDHLDPRVP